MSAVLALILASTLPTIRAEHPRMFFNRDTWPVVKANALKGGTAANAAMKRLVESAERQPAEPVCANFGPVTSVPSEPIENVRDYGPAAARCALAWRLTGNADYLRKAQRALEVSVEAYEAARKNGRAVHWFSTHRVLALCAYDWIFEGLDDDERRRIIVPLVNHIEAIQPGPGRPSIIRRNVGGIETGFYGVSSLLWFSGLAAHGDGYCDGLAKAHLEKGLELNLKMMEYRNSTAGDDGALASGVPDYSMGAYPWAHFNFMHTYLSAFGENLASRYPRMGLFANWIWWNWIPSEVKEHPHCFGFGDDQHEQNYLMVRRLYEHMSGYMTFFRKADPDAARLAATLRELAPNRLTDAEWPMYALLLPEKSSVKPFPVEELEACPLKARHFETLGQFVMRSGWKTDSTYCLFTAGATLQQHRHLDENNFVIYKRDFLALDSGSRGMETDTNLRYYYAQTVAHNCVLVHKPNEPMPYHWGLDSKEPAARFNYGGQYPGSAKVLAFRTTGDFTYVAADAANVYGKKTTAAVRQFVHVQPDVFVVYDRVDAESADYCKEWLLHTESEPRIDGALMTADCGEGRLFCQTLLPAEATCAKVGGSGREFWANGKNWELDPKFVKAASARAAARKCGPYFGAWRLVVSPAKPAKADRFLHLLVASDTGVTAMPVAARCETRGDRDAVRFDYGGRKFELEFNRAGTVGAAIVIDGKRTELCNAVEPQSGVMR